MKNIIYYPYINKIGGIESFLFYLAKKYKNYDLTVYYGGGDPEQIKRLARYVRVKRYRGEKIKCEKAFFNWRLDIIDNVEAEEYIQIIHCDFIEAQKIGVKPNTHPKITKYIAVSKNACKSFETLTGITPELCYNPIAIEKPRKVLNLISATRLSGEKGKGRMIQFANMLDAANIPYIWLVFTADANTLNNKNIVCLPPRLDIGDYIANADYLVQLSDTEGYPYSILEALTLGTPVVVTDLPVLKEMKANEQNAFILDFEMKNVPIEKIYKGLPPFEYTPNADIYNKLLAKGKSTYQAEIENNVFVKPIKSYFDVELQKYITANDEAFEVTRFRADALIDAGVAELIIKG